MLSDAQMKQFIVSGYLVVKTSLPPEFHKDIYQRTEEVFKKEGNPGNNLIARIPDIKRILDDTAVNECLEGVLGPNYFIEPHRHCHFNPPGSDGQTLHKDSFTRRRHHTRWVMAMYYPQDTPLEMGPTTMLPGSQYYNTIEDDDIGVGTPMIGEAGTVIICNYDIRHGGSPNTSIQNRYMMKFLATRMEEPRNPGWSNQEEDWDVGYKEGFFHGIPQEITDHGQNIWKHLWDWHRGSSNKQLDSYSTSFGDIGDLLFELGNESEAVALEAAYALSDNASQSTVSSLIDIMLDEESSIRWHEVYQTHTKGQGFHSRSANASYALSAMGSLAVPDLIDVASHDDWWARASAVEALTDIGWQAKDAVPVLCESIKDESVLVRTMAAEGLGTISLDSDIAVSGLTLALQDRSPKVRRNASLSMARMGVNSKGAVSTLKDALEDEDRYVRGYAVHALYRTGETKAKDILIDYLMPARWCHSTTRDSTY